MKSRGSLRNRSKDTMIQGSRCSSAPLELPQDPQVLTLLNSTLKAYLRRRALAEAAYFGKYHWLESDLILCLVIVRVITA
jgi:hypothetical protein